MEATDRFQATTQYEGFDATSQSVLWSWEVVDSFDAGERGQLMAWARESSTLPPSGFRELSFLLRRDPRGFGLRDTAFFPRSLNYCGKLFHASVIRLAWAQKVGGQAICLHDVLSAFLVEISLAGRCVRASVEIDGMEYSADKLPRGEGTASMPAVKLVWMARR